MRRARWKRKNVRDELTVEAANSPIRRSSRYGLPPKSGNLLPAALKVRKEPSASPHLEAGHLPGCKPERLSATVPCVPLRYALPGPFSALSSSLVLRPLGGWFPKAGAEAPGLCVVGGPGRSRNALVLFFRGCGAGSFPEKNAPHVPAVGTVPCGSRELCESARHRRALPCYPKS